MKRIAIAVLTLVMIFSFVACEATTVQPWYGKMVTNVTVASAPAYFAGETINPADITLNIQYDNGSATVNGVEAGLLPAESTNGYTVQTGAYTKLKLQYGYDRSGEVLEWDVYVPTVKATGLTVTAANVPTTAFASEEEAMKALASCLTYTLSYEGGTKAVSAEVAAENVPTGTPDIKRVASADGKTEQITYTLKETSTNNLPVTSSPITVTVSTVDETKVIDAESFVITQSAEQEFYAVNGKWRATHAGNLDTNVATLEDVDFTVSAKTLAGAKVDFTVVDTLAAVDGEKDAYVDFDDYALTQKLNDSKLGNFAVTITYMYNGEIETAKATFDFKYTEDYVKTFKVTAPTTKYNPGQEILEKDFKFVATAWASDEKYENSTKNDLSYKLFDVQPNYVPYGYGLTAGETEVFDIDSVVVDKTSDLVKYATIDSSENLTINVNLPKTEA